jgi:hypothetical protein
VTDFKVDAVNWPGTSEEVFSTIADGAACPTRTSGEYYSLYLGMQMALICPTSTSGEYIFWNADGSACPDRISDE